MRRHIILLIGLVLVPLSLAAQETTGAILGRLHSTVGATIEGALVTATGPDLPGTRRSASGRDGVFQLLALPPGRYELRLSAIGYRPTVVEGVQVRLGRVTGLGAIALEPAAVSLTEVKITAPSITIDPVRTTIGATLESADYAALPTERDYKSLITILPHINTSYHGDPANSAGSTGLENMYFLDGVNVTSAYHAETGTSLPYNFVRSVEVRTGGYEAQYGRAMGAIVNAVTYTGTNRFEGNVFGFFTHDAFSFAPKAEPNLASSGGASYDIGARVSGPLIRDRMWFSAAYNPRFSRVDKVIGDLGTFSDRRRADVFAGKITWQSTPVQTIELSVFGDPTRHHAVERAGGLAPRNPDPFLRLLETGGIAASLRATTVLGPAGLLEAAISRSSGLQNKLGDTERGRTEAVYADFVAGTIEGGMPFPIYVSEARTAAMMRGTVRMGRHTFVAGLEYEVMRLTRASGSLPQDQDRPGTAIGHTQRIDVDRFFVDSEFVSGTTRNVTPNGYLQDSWRAGERLTVSAGLRWSRQSFKGASGRTVQRLEDEWQPRLGFSWQLDAAGRQRLFGSYGRFYQQLPLNLASIWFAPENVKYKFFSTDPREPGAVPDQVIDASTTEASFPQADGLRAEHVDEFTAGYERVIGSQGRVTIRGVRRKLRSAFRWAFDLSRSNPVVIGNPGEGDLSFLPRPRREYTALELAIAGVVGGVTYQASYVLSRTRGNDPGLYLSDFYAGNPGIGILAEDLSVPNSSGLLPNDRTHVFKLTGSYGWRAVQVGGFFTWQSGTPLTEFGYADDGAPLFLSPRGSVGRTRAPWDVNLRVSYEGIRASGAQARVILDLLHVGNPRTTTRRDQDHFFLVDAAGNRSSWNAGYLSAIGFQPPMHARLGIEVSF